MAGQNVSWIEATTEENGVDVHVKLRDGIPVGKRASFPHQISIVWDYDGMSDGMPPAETAGEISRFDQALQRLDESLSDAFLMISVLGDDRAEWIWYTADVEQYMATFSTAMSDFKESPIDMETIEDPQWESFNDLRNAVK